MKKLISPLLILCFLFCGCASENPRRDVLSISATLFPQYDFARHICGEKAEVSLLLPPGADSHSYEPTPSDMVTLSRADLFLYTGDKMEPWAARLAAGAEGLVVDVSAGATLLGGTHDHEHHAHAEDSTDPHIWTNPQNAIIMAENICEAVCALDAENAEFYRANAAEYIHQLEKLDADFKAAIETAKRRTLVFGGHFAMRYLTEHYGLSHHAAFDSCSGETEASPAVLMELIQKIRTENIPAVYYEEMSTPRIASLLAEETGAKMLLLHSCHNISAEEKGETYLSLMRKNLENLKIGLN